MWILEEIKYVSNSQKRGWQTEPGTLVMGSMAELSNQLRQILLQPVSSYRDSYDYCLGYSWAQRIKSDIGIFPVTGRCFSYAELTLGLHKHNNIPISFFFQIHRSSVLCGNRCFSTELTVKDKQHLQLRWKG